MTSISRLKKWQKDFASTAGRLDIFDEPSQKIKMDRVEEIVYLQSFGPPQERISAAKLKKWQYVDLLSYKIFLRECVANWSAPPVGFGESRISNYQSAKPFEMLDVNYVYQRNGLQLVSDRPFSEIYPGSRSGKLWRSRGQFASSGQAALTTVLQALRSGQAGVEFRIQEDLYWESMDLIRQTGLKITRGKIRKKGNRSPVFFFDSSTELKGRRFSLHRQGAFQWLILDTTCFSQGSNHLREIITQSLKRKVPVILIRSHHKLDALGIEFSRLGSVVALWDEQFSKSQREEIENFWTRFTRFTRLLGTSAMLKQWYPFLSDRRFQQLNESRNKKIRVCNRVVAGRLGRFVGANVRLVEFEHSYFFLIVISRALSQKKTNELASSFYRLCRLKGVMAVWIASYAWDFVGMTSFAQESEFFPQAKKSTVFRFSVPDLDRHQMEQLISAFRIWIRFLTKMA